MIKQIAFVRGTITNEYAWKDKFHFMVVIGPKERVAKTSKCLEKLIIWDFGIEFLIGQIIGESWGYGSII